MNAADSLWGAMNAQVVSRTLILLKTCPLESGTDKRLRESPDSTLKPEGKSLKTSEPKHGPDDHGILMMCPQPRV